MAKIKLFLSLIVFGLILSSVGVSQKTISVSMVYAQTQEEGGLDLDSVQVPKDAVVEANDPWWHLASTIFSILLLLGLVYFSPKIAGFFSRGRETTFSYDISTLPPDLLYLLTK